MCKVYQPHLFKKKTMPICPRAATARSGHFKPASRFLKCYEIALKGGFVIFGEAISHITISSVPPLKAGGKVCNPAFIFIKLDTQQSESRPHFNERSLSQHSGPESKVSRAAFSLLCASFLVKHI